jgi:hypothetical protein
MILKIREMLNHLRIYQTMFNNNCFIKASTLRLRFRSITNNARGSAGGGAGGLGGFVGLWSK